MTENDIGLNALAVWRLVFVDEVTFPANAHFVFIELSPRLVSILPVEYHALQVMKDNLTVANVLARYERYVQKLKRHEKYEALEVAEEMLKTAKIQATTCGQ